MSGFLNGARPSKCPRFLAREVPRWSNMSLRSEVLSGCVKAQTSSGSALWSRISMLGVDNETGRSTWRRA